MYPNISYDAMLTPTSLKRNRFMAFGCASNRHAKAIGGIRDKRTAGPFVGRYQGFTEASDMPRGTSPIFTASNSISDLKRSERLRCIPGGN